MCVYTCENTVREELVKEDIDVVSSESIVTPVTAVAMTSCTLWLAIALYIPKREKLR